MTQDSTIVAGWKGEDLAVNFLQKNGYKILTRNFHSRFGEIDIVAIDKNILVFVEVKTRTNRHFGSPEEAVTLYKIRSIIKTGEYYKILNPKTPGALRVDVVAIEIENEEVKEIRLIKNVSQ